MYEAPDRYKRMISARLPDGESLGLASEQVDDDSSPLKDVQLISRAQLAPFFAAANIVAARDDDRRSVGRGRSPYLLLPGRSAVAGVNLVRDAARPHAGDHPCRPLGHEGAANG